MSSKRLRFAAAGAALAAVLWGLPETAAFRLHPAAPAAAAAANKPWGMGQHQQQHSRRPRAAAARMMAAAGQQYETPPPPAALDTHKPQGQRHSRRAALQLAGSLVLGPLAMAVGADSAAAAAVTASGGGGGGAGDAAAVVAGASTHKSRAELQFEMMKLGLDLTCVRA